MAVVGHESVAPAHDQDAPRVRSNTFTVTNPHDGKFIEVVYASFAACLEREANALRQDMRPESAEKMNRKPTSAVTVKVGQIWLDNYRYAMANRFVRIVSVEGDVVLMKTCTITGQDILQPGRQTHKTKLFRFNGKAGGFSLIVDV